MLERICIIGTGLIGCSFAQAIKSAGFTGHITGSARQQRTLDDALAAGCIDSGCTDPARAAEGADLVMLAVPMRACRQVLEAIEPVLQPDTIVTDGGSVKGSFIRDTRDILRYLDQVVPGHPVAGRERSGVAAAQADLYVGKRVLLTPLPETSATAVATVTELWELTGAIVECLDPDHHDRVLAATSHLPHVLAFALVDLLASKHEHEEIFRYAAGGFRDFTRIASGDPVMWRDICLSNDAEIVVILDAYMAQLTRLRTLVTQSNGAALEAVFARSREARKTHGLAADTGVTQRAADSSSCGH